jgi:uncharacterized protein YggE
MKTHLTRTLFFTLLLTILSTSFMTAHAQDALSTRRTITVNGEGTIEVEPDMATVRFGVVTRNDDPEEARRLNAASAREAMNAVRALGVEERKIRLETLRLQPLRVYNPETRQQEENGYEAVRGVVVDLENLELLPELVSTVVQKGANQLDGVSYGLTDRNAVRNEALSEAVLDARSKAMLMARTLDSEIGEVLQIHELGVNVPRPMMRMEMMESVAGKAMSAPEPEAYAAGVIEVNANVSIVFALQ